MEESQSEVGVVAELTQCAESCGVTIPVGFDVEKSLGVMAGVV